MWNVSVVGLTVVGFCLMLSVPAARHFHSVIQTVLFLLFRNILVTRRKASPVKSFLITLSVVLRSVFQESGTGLEKQRLG